MSSLTKTYVAKDVDGLFVIPTKWVNSDHMTALTPMAKNFDKYAKANVTPDKTWSTIRLIKLYNGLQDDNFCVTEKLLKDLLTQPPTDSDSTPTTTHKKNVQQNKIKSVPAAKGIKSLKKGPKYRMPKSKNAASSGQFLSTKDHSIFGPHKTCTPATATLETHTPAIRPPAKRKVQEKETCDSDISISSKRSSPVPSFGSEGEFDFSSNDSNEGDLQGKPPFMASFSNDREEKELQPQPQHASIEPEPPILNIANIRTIEFVDQAFINNLEEEDNTTGVRMVDPLHDSPKCDKETLSSILTQLKKTNELLSALTSNNKSSFEALNKSVDTRIKAVEVRLARLKNSIEGKIGVRLNQSSGLEVTDAVYKRLISYFPISSSQDISDFEQFFDEEPHNSPALMKYFSNYDEILGAEGTFKGLLTSLFSKHITDDYTWHGHATKAKNQSNMEKKALKNTKLVILLTDFIHQKYLADSSFYEEKISKWGKRWVDTARDSLRGHKMGNTNETGKSKKPGEWENIEEKLASNNVPIPGSESNPNRDCETLLQHDAEMANHLKDFEAIRQNQLS